MVDLDLWVARKLWRAHSHLTILYGNINIYEGISNHSKHIQFFIVWRSWFWHIHTLSVDSIYTQTPSPLHLSLREYPRGLGDAVHEVYLQQLKGPAHGDLRMRISPDETKNAVELFKSMELGDCWDDANLKPCFDYLYGCKHTRTMGGMFISLAKFFVIRAWHKLLLKHLKDSWRMEACYRAICRWVGS